MPQPEAAIDPDERELLTPAERLLRMLKPIFGPRHPAGISKVQICDPRFDDWPVVRDFGELRAALAWRGRLDEFGIEAVLTSDWPLDRWGHGDIALRVPPGMWSEAEELLGEGGYEP